VTDNRISRDDKSVWRKTLLVSAVVSFIVFSLSASYLSYEHFRTSVRRAVKDDREKVQLFSLILKEHIQRIVNTMESYGRRPLLIKAVREKNVARAGEHMADLSGSNPDIDLLFITDKEGTLWYSYPHYPELSGKNFGRSEEYKKVSKDWKVYISDLTTRMVGEKEPAIRIFVPVIDPSGKVLGVIFNTQRTTRLSKIFQQVTLDPGVHVSVADRQGRLIYSSRPVYDAVRAPYPFFHVARDAKSRTVTVTDPYEEGAGRYVSFATLKDIGWSVFVGRSRYSIFAAEISFYIQVAVIAVLLFAVFNIAVVLLKKNMEAGQLLSRLEAEEKLRESEARFRTMFMTGAVARFIGREDDGTIMEVNDRFLEMYGRTRDETIGRTALDLGMWAIPAAREELMAKVRTCDRVDNFEVLARRKDGEIFHALYSLGRMTHAGTALIIGSISDISELKRGEEVLRKTAEQLTMAQTAAHIGVWDWNVSTGRIEWSPQMFTLFGIDPLKAEASFEAWRKALHPEDAAIAGQRIEKALQERTTLNSDYRIVFPDGGIRWINAVGESRYDERGQPVRMIGICSDITERKRTDKALRESEARFRGYFELPTHGLAITSPEKGWIEVNTRICTLLGYSKDEIRKLTWSDMTHPDDLDADVAHFNRVLSGEIDQYNLDKRFLRKDGSVIWANLSVGCVRNPDHTVDYFIVLLEDVTERKLEEQKRRELEERLLRSEKMEALGLLAGGVAHDLNNTLGILVGYSELLYDGLNDDDPLREIAGNVIKGGERSAAIVQDLLTLARRGIQTRAAVDLNRIVREYLESPEHLRITAMHPNIRVTTELENGLLRTMGSQVHISKTLMNLVSNAAEAMNEGGNVVIRTENRYLDKPVSGYDDLREGDYVVLSVSDEGGGITDDERKRIFEPFFTKKVMGRSGTGLGLSVVWGTMKDHNGYIDVESETGRGTAFHLYFPITQDQEAEGGASATATDYMGRGEKILVVDDVGEQRDLAGRILENLGYTVHAAASGEEAVEYLRSHEADLVVLDMIMEPGIDGFETYRLISKSNPRQKAVIVSGYAETDTVKMAQSMGAGAFVRKPYIKERIGLAIRKELDRK